MFISMQKINFISFFFWDNAKALQTCYFGYSGQAWPWLVKATLPACRKLWCLYSCKKIIFIPHLSWNITKILQACYFRYFGHVWPRPPTATELTCRKLWCLSANKNQLDPSIFLQILHFKESCNLIGQEHTGQ